MNSYTLQMYQGPKCKNEILSVFNGSSIVLTYTQNITN